MLVRADPAPLATLADAVGLAVVGAVSQATVSNMCSTTWPVAHTVDDADGPEQAVP